MIESNIPNNGVNETGTSCEGVSPGRCQVTGDKPADRRRLYLTLKKAGNFGKYVGQQKEA